MQGTGQSSDVLARYIREYRSHCSQVQYLLEISQKQAEGAPHAIPSATEAMAVSWCWHDDFQRAGLSSRYRLLLKISRNGTTARQDSSNNHHADEVHICTPWHPWNIGVRQHAIRQSTIPRFHHRMGNRAENIQPGVPTIKWPKRANDTDHQTDAPQRRWRGQRPLHIVATIPQHPDLRASVLTCTAPHEQKIAR